MAHIAEADRAWRARQEAVLARAEAFAHDHAGAAHRRRLLSMALSGVREQAARRDHSSTCIHLAPLVYAGLWGTDEPAYPVAVAATLLRAGLTLCDAPAGDGTPEDGSSYPLAEVQHVAVALWCSLPHLAIATLEAPPSVLAAMHEMLASGLLRIAAGRERELRLDGTPTELASTLGATDGEHLALIAALGAQLAGAAPRVIDACRELGRSLGMGGRLAADCRAAFAPAGSPSPAHGARSLPVALYLARLEDADRQAFLALLERARGDTAAHEAVRARLRGAGESRHCAALLAAHRRQALEAVANAGLLEPARSLLHTMVAAISMSDCSSAYKMGRTMRCADPPRTT